jgi:uncharacterized protein YkwD
MTWQQRLRELLAKLFKRPPVDPPPPPPPPPQPPTERMSKLVAALNRERAAEGLAAYSADSDLTAAAQKHAEYITRMNIDLRTQNGHIGEGGSEFGERIAAEGYQGQSVSEIVAGRFPDVESVVAAWMSSPGHRAEILSRRANQCGPGYAGYWCVVFGKR